MKKVRMPAKPTEIKQTFEEALEEMETLLFPKSVDTTILNDKASNVSLEVVLQGLKTEGIIHHPPPSNIETALGGSMPNRIFDVGYHTPSLTPSTASPVGPILIRART